MLYLERLHSQSNIRLSLHSDTTRTRRCWKKMDLSWSRSVENGRYRPDSCKSDWCTRLRPLTVGWCITRSIAFTGRAGRQSTYKCSITFALRTEMQSHVLKIDITPNEFRDTSADNLRYLNVDQALADLAYFIETKKKEKNLENSPVIVFGGSYAGNMAAWARLKYPHLIQVSSSSGRTCTYLENWNLSENF